MSTRFRLKMMLLVPLTLFACSQSSDAQVCPNAAASTGGTGTQQNLNAGNGGLFNLLRINQAAAFQNQQQFIMQQRILMMQQQQMMRQRELARLQAEKNSAEKEEPKVDAEVAEIKKPEKPKKKYDDELSPDEKLRRSLFKLEQQNGLTSRSSKTRK